MTFLKIHLLNLSVFNTTNMNKGTNDITPNNKSEDRQKLEMFCVQPELVFITVQRYTPKFPP